jgi:hypothetical protein
MIRAVAFFLIGGTALLVALALALYAGGTVRRTAVLVIVGLAACAVWLFAEYVAAVDGSRPTSCSDCGVYLGKWLDPTAIFVVIGGNVVGWIVGTVAGSVIRAVLDRGRLDLPAS